MDYKEKLRLAKEALESGSYDRETIEYIFPELRESEDERIRKALMQNLKERFGTKGNMGEGLDMPDVLAWFEKKKESQPIEWSKEDEDTIKFLISHFCTCYPTSTFQFTTNEVISHDELLRKIRHLRPQPQWKPSKEQMDALRYVTNFDYGGHKAILVSLYEQLKNYK